MPNLSWVPFVLVPIGFVWVSSCSLYAYIKRMRKHPFPDRKTAEFVFRERRASGYSDKDWMSRHGGASNCLTVAVTCDEPWVYSPDIMAAVSERIDLECRVVLCDVVDVQQDKKIVRVSFRLAAGKVRTLTLRVKRAGALVEAIEAGLSEDPA